MSGTLTAKPQPSARAGRLGPIIDCDIHNYMGWTSSGLTHGGVLSPYLSPRWRHYYETFGMRTPNTIQYFPTRPRKMAARSDAWPESGPPGSDLPLMREQHLDLYGITYGILNPIDQILMGSQFPEYSAALTRALNDFTLAEWLEKDERLLGSICVAYENGDLAAEEIHRRADDPRFVQVLVNVRTREPLGSRRYWKIYEAAAEHDLPVAVHVGGAGGNAITGAGFPSYYFEDHNGYAQAYHTHVISLVCEGVFEKFPNLKWVMQEGGFAWIPWLSWRLDRAWHVLKDEVPQVKELPSEYVKRHFWYTTQPIEEPELPGQFGQLLDQLDAMGVTDRLLFSSDYPHWDFDAPDRAMPREMSKEVKQRVLSANAAALYGLEV